MVPMLSSIHACNNSKCTCDTLATYVTAVTCNSDHTRTAMAVMHATMADMIIVSTITHTILTMVIMHALTNVESTCTCNHSCSCNHVRSKFANGIIM